MGEDKKELKGNLNNDQRVAVENMHKTFLEALRHREQEILRFLAILAPALGGFVWLLKVYSESKVDPLVFIVVTLGVLLLLTTGAVYSLALSYNFRTIIRQLATLESKECLNIDKYILKSWPRKSEKFEKYIFKKIPWCSPPEIIKPFWLAFIIGIIGVMLVVYYICPMKGKCLILIIGAGCVFISVCIPVHFGMKIHEACDEDEKKRLGSEKNGCF